VLIATCIGDFVQPRDLWNRVFNDTEKQNFVNNVSGHLKVVTSNTIKDNQRMLIPPTLPRNPGPYIWSLLTVLVFKKVDQGLANRIADAIGRPHP
jgi:catalase